MEKYAFIITGEGASGKDFTIAKLLAHFQDSLQQADYYTTRAIRPSDQNYVHQITDAQYDQIVNSGDYLTYKVYNNKKYVTVLSNVIEILKHKNVLLNITPDVHASVKDKLHAYAKVFTIKLYCSKDVRRQRLQKRDNPINDPKITQALENKILEDDKIWTNKYRYDVVFNGENNDYFPQLYAFISDPEQYLNTHHTYHSDEEIKQALSSATFTR